MFQVLGQTFNPTQLTPNRGWECPKCRRVYSPTTQMCLFCPASYTTTHTITGGGGSAGVNITSGVTTGGVGVGAGNGSTGWNLADYGDEVPSKPAPSITFTIKNEKDTETRCSTCGLMRSMSGYSNCPEGFHFSK